MIGPEKPLESRFFINTFPARFSVFEAPIMATEVGLNKEFNVR
jgi:hypothetical protein